METAAIAEQPAPEIYAPGQSAPVTNGGNHPLNIAVLPKGVALADRPRPREHSAHNGDTAIKLYLCDIGQVKQLTQEEENELIGRTRRGDRKARERLIKGNLRRVVEISREYENISLPLLDLISEGNVGLIKAVERFEPNKGSQFSTFSAWWVKQSIKRALANQSKTIPRQLDKGNPAGLLRFPVEGNTCLRSRPANVRILNAIRRSHC